MDFKASRSPKSSFACLVLVVFVGAFYCASGQTTDENLKKLATANNIFALKLHRVLSDGSKGNVFFSPLSLSTVFGMLYYGVIGESAKELRQALGYDAAGLPDEEIAPTFHQLINQISNASDEYKLLSANAILVAKSLSLRPEYKNGIQDLYHSPVRAVDFSKDGSKIVKSVNDWVRAKTQGMIRKVLNEVDRMTAMVLLNAVYFKGRWKTAFNPRSTKKEDFYNGGLESRSKKVFMMNQESKFPYTDTHDCQAVELPYVGDHLSMLVLLPKQRDGLESLEQSLTITTIDGIRQSMRSKKIQLHLPRFKMEFEKNLPRQLKKLGINKIFKSGTDDFSGISESSSRNLTVTDVVHKSKIDVNEEGTEAAASTTAVMLFVRVQQRKVVFRADHPFVFFILDKRSGMIVFMGRVSRL